MNNKKRLVSFSTHERTFFFFRIKTQNDIKEWDRIHYDGRERGNVYVKKGDRDRYRRETNRGYIPYRHEKKTS